ncbi:hypothetical protein Vi05172_g3639 [Venturia inaequalis]|nr:hypothetical protein Vi05172_g3639 [Venturia inaequalis]
MKFLASVIMALSFTFQLAAAECNDCIKSPTSWLGCVNAKNVGCGICCTDASECIKARHWRQCSDNPHGN